MLKRRQGILPSGSLNLKGCRSLVLQSQLNHHLSGFQVSMPGLAETESARALACGEDQPRPSLWGGGGVKRWPALRRRACMGRRALPPCDAALP
jgi:hypothetical protein